MTIKRICLGQVEAAVVAADHFLAGNRPLGRAVTATPLVADDQQDQKQGDKH
jgi:hypothetical protein